MRRRTAGLLLAWSWVVAGQGTVARKSAAEYPVQAVLPNLTLAAEFLVRSLPARGLTFVLEDYLVVEVAVFPAPGQTVAVAARHFSLRLGGKKKEVLSPHGPEFVMASLKYPDWERRRQLEAVAGAGSGAVILGRPPAVERFPGDRRPGYPPPRPPAPDAEIRPEPVRAEEVVAETVLSENEAKLPISGYLYFPYKGKTATIRPVELVYQGPAGTATLRFH